ncbi:hypothetical protein LR48_Vigan11g066200 [Vigna angularis]|uniref:Uncharacterized protein n=1 Tax=Phaseolus angularis TaxID=3914 RepID=A0A0L9VSA1_PHAAN|nr:hypothetical protein LR48_Vigan11g066200 [Vigna angularis]
MASSSSKSLRTKEKVARVTRNANPSGWISDEEIRGKLLSWRDIKNVVPHKYLDLQLFSKEGFLFQEWIAYQGLTNFVQMKGDCYPNLVVVFYTNMRDLNGVIHSRTVRLNHAGQELVIGADFNRPFDQALSERSVKTFSCNDVLSLGSSFRRPFRARPSSAGLQQAVPYTFTDHSDKPSKDRSVKASADRTVGRILYRFVHYFIDHSTIFSRSFLNLSTVIVLHKMIEIIKPK